MLPAWQHAKPCAICGGEEPLLLPLQRSVEGAVPGTRSGGDARMLRQGHAAIGRGGAQQPAAQQGEGVARNALANEDHGAPSKMVEKACGR